MHLVGINLSFSYLGASSQVLVGLNCLDKICLVIFHGEKELILLFKHVPFSIGCTG